MFFQFFALPLDALSLRMYPVDLLRFVHLPQDKQIHWMRLV